MLRTAPPTDIERGLHRSRLTHLGAGREASEGLGIVRSGKTFSRMPAGPGLGGMFLSTLAGAFVGTAIYGAFFGRRVIRAVDTRATSGGAARAGRAGASI